MAIKPLPPKHLAGWRGFQPEAAVEFARLRQSIIFPSFCGLLLGAPVMELASGHVLVQCRSW